MGEASPLQSLLEVANQSPLASVDPRSLDELMLRAREIFNKKPLDLTEEEISTTVAYFSATREKAAKLIREKELTRSSRTQTKPIVVRSLLDAKI